MTEVTQALSDLDRVVKDTTTIAQYLARPDEVPLAQLMRLT